VRVGRVRGFLTGIGVYGLHGLGLGTYEFRRDYESHRDIAGF